MISPAADFMNAKISLFELLHVGGGLAPLLALKRLEMPGPDLPVSGKTLGAQLETRPRHNGQKTDDIDDSKKASPPVWTP